MCGISGIYTTHSTGEHKKILEEIVKYQTPRGPDHQEIISVIKESCQVLLGHNRLSIIDLSEKANQPMWDVTGRYCIVYNGEIYNYIEIREELISIGLPFHSHSDTEVILNAFAYWGIDALKKFRGPFAFALFDVEKEQLWLCRDRFGIRPLYYLQRNNTLYFASTVRSLAKQLNLKPNLGYIAQGLKYLVYEDGSDISPYEDILSLPAGCYLQIKVTSGKTITSHIYQYYDLTNSVQSVIDDSMQLSTHDFLALITDQLEQSVKIRLRTDVPLAISLSGGLDSSSVASLVNKQYQNVLGFSFADATNKRTEGPMVAHCAKFLNIKIEYVWPTATEMIDALFKTIDTQEAPFSSFSVVAQYLLYQRVRSAGIKVLLGGQGGDEVFMGYKKFMLFRMKQLIQNKSYLETFKSALQLVPMLFAEISSLNAYWKHRHRYLNSHSRHTQALKLPDCTMTLLNKTEQPLWLRQSQDILQLSLPTLLRYEDRNAMGNSVESRLPYMDHQLVELGLALPTTLKLQAGYGKWAIRKIMHNKLPDKIRLARYKRGFDISIKTLLKSGLGSRMRSVLDNNQDMLKDFLKLTSNIDTLYSDHQLLQRPSAMTEMISLLWLNKVLS